MYYVILHTQTQIGKVKDPRMIISILSIIHLNGEIMMSVSSWTSKRESERKKSKHQRTNEQSVSNDTLRSTPKLKYISVVTLLLIWRRDNNSNNGENVWPKLYSSYMLGLAGWLVCISHRSWELRKSWDWTKKWKHIKHGSTEEEVEEKQNQRKNTQ